VNLAQIRLAVPEIFEAQTKKNKKSKTALKTEPHLRAVKIQRHRLKPCNDITA